MKFGVHVRPTAETLDARTIGRMVEAHGFESVFFPEHTHIPTATQSKYPDDPEWLRRCMRLLDPFVAFGAVAAVTERLRLGTGVCLVPQHHPITLAKQVATLDLLSGGRVLFGVGAGWGREEMANHGTDPALRWRLMRERVLAIKRIWTEDAPEFEGQLVRFGPIWQWPKPVQKPHPPILVGGEGPRVLERVVDYGDEWMPNDHPELELRVGELQRLAAARGRGPIPVTVFDAPSDPALIQRYAAAGVTRCVFTIASNDAEQFGATLARLQELIYGLRSSPVHSSSATFAIRPYHPSDLYALYRICLRTGASGADASSLYRDPELLGHYFAAPYAVLEPDLCFVLTCAGAPCGYILGTRDTAAFAERCERDWFPALRARYPLPEADDQTPDAQLIRRIHAGRSADPDLAAYPAHLHIDLLPIAQGQGWGRRLMHTFHERLRDLAVPGVYLNVGTANRRAVRFYEQVGFERIKVYDTAVTFGMRLRVE